MLSDEPGIAEGNPTGWMSIPLEKEDIRTVQQLPPEAKKEMVRNIRQYVKQLGKEYGSNQPVSNSAIRL